jgi:hypothetical protein
MNGVAEKCIRVLESININGTHTWENRHRCENNNNKMDFKETVCEDVE